MAADPGVPSPGPDAEPWLGDDLAGADLGCYWETPRPVQMVVSDAARPGELPSVREVGHLLVEAFQRGEYAHRDPAAPPQTFVRLDATTFFCMIPLPGDALDDAVAAWWSADRRGGALVVRRRLRLGEPVFRRDLGGWQLAGRLRRRPSSLPMTLQLSPRLSYGTLVHLRPERTVHPSGRYFRLGHAILRELGARLVESRAAAR